MFHNCNMKLVLNGTLLSLNVKIFTKVVFNNTEWCSTTHFGAKGPRVKIIPDLQHETSIQRQPIIIQCCINKPKFLYWLRNWNIFSWSKNNFTYYKICTKLFNCTDSTFSFNTKNNHNINLSSESPWVDIFNPEVKYCSLVFFNPLGMFYWNLFGIYFMFE